MNVSRYRKRPVTVEAARVPAEPDAELELWLGEWFESWLPSHGALVFHVVKGGGEATVHAGDWIIKEPDGNGFYPCTAEDFARTYEPVQVGSAWEPRTSDA